MYKECDWCVGLAISITDTENVFWSIDENKAEIIIDLSDIERFRFSINYCPKCGKRLTKEPVMRSHDDIKKELIAK